ncbi:hypothetical protein [Acetilactobacillus jinshanensis]|uniref:Uncharacterized protein n=1 Tax=Acetilactobacillus jinshanensis TaxID=1720083 RepID=A0A4P6ZK88_9LACO|nr:hypothetical protein [Acetilactobacillus jinshanensis]QBP18068.1 hypothetical protein ELX58_02670 [Acetilactobacillus jinshanensis]URL60931.1 hypothetical protein HGK75_02710 [uncultured bacterium]
MSKQLSLNLSSKKKTPTVDEIILNSEHHMIDHPCDVTKIVIDCFLSDYCFGIDQEVGDAQIYDPQDIQEMSAALVRIMSYNRLLNTTHQLANKYYNKQASLKETEDAIIGTLDGKVIRYIPFGSKLHKDFKKLLRKTGYGVEGLISGMEDNLFGYFYCEPKENNIVKRLMTGTSKK